MTLNPLTFLKRHESVRVLLIGKNASNWKFKTLIKEGDFVKDVPGDKAYGPVGKFRPFYDSKGKPTYIFEEESGAALQAELGEDVLKLTTDASLMARLTDKQLLSNALQRQPQFGMLIITAIAAFFFGISLGGAYG